MTESPRQDPTKTSQSRTTKSPSTISAPMLIFLTALDTTWRAFVPIIGGVFAGIGLDHLFSIAPIATVVCLLLGVVVSAILIVKQLRDVRKPLR